jgi:hypothetical protein
LGRRKKKQDISNGDNDDDQYVDLSDDEIVVEDDDDDDLSDLYPGQCANMSNHEHNVMKFFIEDFRRLRASDGKPANATTMADEDPADSATGTKRKAQVSQVDRRLNIGISLCVRMTIELFLFL